MAGRCDEVQTTVYSGIGYRFPIYSTFRIKVFLRSVKGKMRQIIQILSARRRSLMARVKLPRFDIIDDRLPTIRIIDRVPEARRIDDG